MNLPTKIARFSVRAPDLRWRRRPLLTFLEDVKAELAVLMPSILSKASADHL